VNYYRSQRSAQESFLSAQETSDRDTAKDALLGIVLLLAALLVFAVCLIPVAGIFWVVDHAGKYLATRAGIPTDTGFTTFICLLALVSAFQNLWKRHWLNVLLSLAIIPMAMVAWLKGLSSTSNFLWLLPLWLLFAIPDSRRLPFLQFISGVLLAAATFLLSIGLFGHASLARALDDILSLAMFAWAYFYIFRDRIRQVGGNAATGP
jgi:hypothetical protein